ncbi:keto-deoxy-phosphogluconate aldolase [Phaeobacter gallaeciensis]|uniref:2-dehydro-3-deoxy-phosphogluconate aldolase n=3 Tax=Rhodobacterales TaxID=204455 RepID=A0A366WR98_9RHOB|nr:bifunctional 4-hydroxy-2-oxoglutarate aldolase/2-dehydro-3-deoxy-phosphogluconate aldolase [Phaeobacter gallaeciensis]MBT3139756.1 bifunctional 4-hydroxy-2-oxoglutarate aldolase/2-dehydro-3-deoxy-phosphogluconate aldolase [Falsiruegeria litorea]MBT8168039.1 bifunctional 4-hydroxy-2-oxoglutarate aldolase/2-dehydro-3-deoxy-phosphogluconate aldolase [Falsiruegeria litorea]RBW51331.1 keto-deoxy-phosphogluconate aldolase [Phaeobacter gallaeciensis]
MNMTPSQASHRTRALCGLAPVIPVLVIHDPAHAKPLAEALVKGGLPVLEVTLRTPAALEVIGEMSSVAGGTVGAGTLLTSEDVHRAKDAGAQFGVSPGSTDTLLSATEEADLPLLPGAASASEAMCLAERGYDMLKLFPAEASGGAAMLRALAAPLPHISFCPTGGVGPSNVGSYLSLPNTICVGGSWVAPDRLVQSGNWDEIEKLARAASQLGRD